MRNPLPIFSVCPQSTDDDRKSASIARADGRVELMRVVRTFANARTLLRNPAGRQAGFRASLVKAILKRPPILYLHGLEHRRQRRAAARFFTPRAVDTIYRPLMERTSDELIAHLRTTGRAELDEMALDMAVRNAAEIVGLTNGDCGAMARRLEALVTYGVPQGESKLSAVLAFFRSQVLTMKFLWRDVKPAIAARRRQRREDIISHLLDEGYSERDILIECLTYGAAGMITTREFITMSGWHLLENEKLRERFLAGGEATRIAILAEILRLEPVVGLLFRRIDPDVAVVAVDVRAANCDEAAVGVCPHLIDPDRKTAEKVDGMGLAFGDGEHHCPGEHVALQEAAVFLDRLLRVPGIRLARVPDMGWSALMTSYELRGATLTCDQMA